MKRRDFLVGLSGSVILGSSLFFKCTNTENDDTLYGKIFLRRCLEVFREIQNKEIPKLVYIAIRAAEIYKKGGKLATSFPVNSILNFDARDERTGNRAYLQLEHSPVSEDFLYELQKGDFYLTTDVKLAVRQAKQRGVYVVGISMPQFPNQFTEQDQILIRPEWYSSEETANIVLYSHVPAVDGLVAFPQYPVVPLCPGSSLSQMALFWMLNAEIAYHIEAEKTYPFKSKARDYIETIIFRIYELEKQGEKIHLAAQTMAQKIRGGGTLFVYDKAGTLTAEACGRASGLMMTKRLDLEIAKAGDCVIFGAENSNTPDDLELAKTLIERGLFVVSISPIETDGDRLGTRLNKIVSVGLDNLSGESKGVVSIKNVEHRICPANGLMNIILLWTLTAQFISEMSKTGLEPYIIMGEHLIGGAQYNAAIRRFFEKRGF